MLDCITSLCLLQNLGDGGLGRLRFEKPDLSGFRICGWDYNGCQIPRLSRADQRNHPGKLKAFGCPRLFWLLQSCGIKPVLSGFRERAETDVVTRNQLTARQRTVHTESVAAENLHGRSPAAPSTTVTNPVLPAADRARYDALAARPAQIRMECTEIPCPRGDDEQRGVLTGARFGFPARRV